MKKTTYYLAALFLLATGCKKLVEVNPPVSAENSANIYTNDATAAAVLTGLYINMSSGPLPYSSEPNAFMTFAGSLSADELRSFDALPSFNDYYQNNLNARSDPGNWSQAYSDIFVVNSAIEGMNASTTLTTEVKAQLLGEAYFLRAFNYFYLVNLYGDVPLVTSTDYTKNAQIPRKPAADVYTQIVADLKKAQSLLTAGYAAANAKTETSERVRPNKWAATALLARVYLYMKDYPDAEAQSTAVISQTGLYQLETLDNAFLANNQEAIWQLQPVNAGHDTEDGWTFILPATGPSPDNALYLSDDVYNSFETGDQRKTHWVTTLNFNGINYHYPFKYKVAASGGGFTEYENIFRLGEQYLIRAEARAFQNESTAASDLNAIRSRAGLPAYTGPTDATMLPAILQERRVELFTEMGQRWFDLKRTGTVNSVMAVATMEKGGTWKPSAALFPIPYDQLKLDLLLTQNPGY